MKFLDEFDVTDALLREPGVPSGRRAGLVYIRARYYEPSTGRFISEDSARSGSNWYSYCTNNPVTKVDEEGTDEASDRFALGAVLSLAAVANLFVSTQSVASSTFLSLLAGSVGAALLMAAAYNYAQGLAASNMNAGTKEILKVMGDATKAGSMVIATIRALAEAAKEMAPLGRMVGTIGITMIAASISYFALCTGALLCIEWGT